MRFKKDEILLEVEDCPVLADVALLPVSRRLRLSKVRMPVFKRLTLGEGVSDLGPSSWREARRCSCRLRSSFLSCLSCSCRRHSSCQGTLGRFLYLSLRQLGWPSVQGLSSTPLSTLSAKVGLRSGGDREATCCWKYDVLDLFRLGRGASKGSSVVPASASVGGNWGW
jgi:hypothetical protein